MNSASFLIFCKLTWWWPNIRAETCREYRSYIIKYFVNCCKTEGIITYSLCAVFCLSVVCYFVWYVYFCVLCLIVVPLPPDKNPFEVHLNNNNNNNNNNLLTRACYKLWDSWLNTVIRNNTTITQLLYSAQIFLCYVRLKLAILPHIIHGIMRLVLKLYGVWNRHVRMERVFKLSKIFQLILFYPVVELLLWMCGVVNFSCAWNFQVPETVWSEFGGGGGGGGREGGGIKGLKGEETVGCGGFKLWLGGGRVFHLGLFLLKQNSKLVPVCGIHSKFGMQTSRLKGNSAQTEGLIWVYRTWNMSKL
jgi:hypothetical protein